ncbi:MAG TPA: DUF2891 domain-containing protein, partial [Kofleriaceae bacterium]
MLALAQASQFANLALACLSRELPHKLDHLLIDAADVPSPRVLHPAFYGCFDWHSAVHGHWMLARLLRQFPELPEAAAIVAWFDVSLTAPNLTAEADYFANRRSFERTYGWAWLLQLARELPDPWRANLQPLTDVIVQCYLDFLPKQTYPIRAGTHANTAFGLTFALDYARDVGHRELAELIENRARTYYAADVDGPAVWEPSGDDFLSPCLCEADLMRRVLAPSRFAAWLHAFLPRLPVNLAEPAIVSDRSDGKL